MTPFLIVIINSIFGPYWDTLRKRLASNDVSPLTITNSPNLIGHPIGMGILFLSGLYFIPTDPKFFVYWFIMISIAACSSILTIRGLLETNFFAVQVIGSLSFVANSIFAVLILGEHLKLIQILAISLSVIGVVFFVWPENKKRKLIFDRGILYIILSVLLGGVGSIFYKIATFHTPNYPTFLTGRFIGDLIGWTLVWVISLLVIKRNPFLELKKVYSNKYGLMLAIGVSVSTLFSSWLIYLLHVTTTAILSTLAFPMSFFLSQSKYKEHITFKMWLGTALIILALILFFL